MPAIPVSTTAPAKDRVHLRELDWLMLVTVSLSCLGLVMAVSVVGARVEDGPLVAVKQQSFKLLFGLAAFLTAAVLPMRLLCRLAVPLFFVTTALCLVPHLLPDVNGAHRWIRYGDHQFQPVEPARFFLILTVALLGGCAARRFLQSAGQWRPTRRLGNPSRSMN